MAANNGVSPRFFDGLKRSMVSQEDMLCFLSELNVSVAFKEPESTLRDLLTCDDHGRNCLELVLSVGAWANPLGEWLSRSFPTTLPAALDKGPHTAILLRLVQYVHSHLPRGLKKSGPSPSQDNLALALHAPEVIMKLANWVFDDDKPDIPSTRHRSRKSTSQAQRKWHARKHRDTSPVNDRQAQFDFLRVLPHHVAIPTNLDETRGLAEGLLLKLKALMKEYTVIMRTDGVSETLMSSLLQEAARPLGNTTGPHNERMDPASSDDINISPITVSAFDAPLQSTLYFDAPDDLGDWEIVLSGRAIRELQAAHRKCPASYDIIMKKINELSHAFFFGDNQKPLVRGPNAVPVYEAKLTGNSRLVYHIHCQPEQFNVGARSLLASASNLYTTHTQRQERQVIRIFSVSDHGKCGRMWESLGHQLANLGGRTYRERCTQRVYNRDRSAVISACFPLNNARDEEPFATPDLPADDLEEIHSILVLEKFVKLSQELRNSLVAQPDALPVFNLSAKEVEIVEHPSSCFVIGRSGTGKTTTMLFKILGLERTFASLASFEIAKPRQLFVTKSPVLAARVQDYFKRLSSSLESSRETESAPTPLAKQNVIQRDAFDKPKIMVHRKDIQNQSSLPARFSLLQEGHFPLFLTFDQLASLLISDLLDTAGDWLSAKRVYLTHQQSSRLDQLLRCLSSSKPVINFAIFLARYWPHFPQSLIKDLDPALVFSEILGVIEGAEHSLTGDGRYMDKNTYLTLGERRTNYMFASKRPDIYQLFKKYSKRKGALRDYDAADRTHALLEALDLVGVPGVKVDFLYVDEAQDNLLIDAKLLRSICRNPHGLFWAGDTAQTITVGNSFRFQDLKAFLYRLEERRSGHEGHGASSIKPASFELATNYRSHEGILTCAHSVIEIISHFWPNSLDKMAREKGVVAGIKPLFLRNREATTVKFWDLMKGEDKSNIEFGSTQCILVRDADGRKRVLEEVGEVGIIMTLHESKGQEFDDVLLYEFFESSVADLSCWRVLLNMIPGKKPAPTFNEDLHAGLSSELKLLYVAITRARKRLLIYDTSDKASPLHSFWSHLGHIEDVEISSGKLLSFFGSTSSRQEWQMAADALFDNEDYIQAAEAYKRAKCSRQEAVARAYEHRKAAKIAPLVFRRRNKFLDAANAFLECAVQAVNQAELKTFQRIAGDCFFYAEEYTQAAAAYRTAEECEKALQADRKARMSDEGVQVVKN